MANPNIVNVATINGNSNFQNVSTTNTAIVTNAAGSDKVYKVNVLNISNIDGVNDADITAYYVANVANATTNVSYSLAKTITVPADSTLVLVDKNSSIYLQEDAAIRLAASASGDLQAVCSWEEIS